jgi:predicted phosphodiesterase
LEGVGEGWPLFNFTRIDIMGKAIYNASDKGKAAKAKEYREKYGPDMPTHKLARIMYSENNLLFNDTENARQMLRYIEGKLGRHSVKVNKDTKFFKTEARQLNPYNLPASDETEYEPYYIKGNRILVLSDIHIPYHSIPALTAALDWAKKNKPDTILLNGDTLDCHQLSRFVKDPKSRNFGQELNSFKDFITVLKTEFPKAQIIFKEGNHEERYNHFLYTKANELTGVSEFTLYNIINSRAAGIEYVAEKRILKAGELNIIHGHEFPGGTFSPVNIARGLFLRAKVSCMQGHNHQTSEHTETDMNGRITTTWSVGCLSELHPDYMKLNKWNHGFAFIEVDKDGSFQVHNKRIHKGEVL